jgi:hypothetical protein
VVDHELEDSVAGTLLSPTSGGDNERDPLGLGSAVRCVILFFVMTLLDRFEQHEGHGHGTQYAFVVVIVGIII